MFALYMVLTSNKYKETDLRYSKTVQRYTLRFKLLLQSFKSVMNGLQYDQICLDDKMLRRIKSLGIVVRASSEAGLYCE